MMCSGVHQVTTEQTLSLTIIKSYIQLWVDL